MRLSFLFHWYLLWCLLAGKAIKAKRNIIAKKG